LLAAGALIVTAFLGAHVLSIVALSVALIGIYAAITVFWTLPPSFLSGTAAAAGIALINSIANLGGFFGPYIMGWAKSATGDYSLGFLVLAGGLVVTAAMVLAMSRAMAPRVAPQQA